MLRIVFRNVISVGLIAILAASPVLVRGQETSNTIPAVTIRANTRLVTIDVVVTDKKGAPIAGLKPEDFVLEENGKKQKISIFVPPSNANKTSATAPPGGILSNHPEHLEPAGVLTVLLLDAANSPFKDQAYARLQMLKYVAEHGGSGQTMAVFTLSDRLRVLQQFTSDPQILLTAIKNLRPQEQTLRSMPPPPESHGVAEGSGGGAGGGAALAAVTAAAHQFANLQAAYNQDQRTLITIQAMKALCRILGGLPGRKNVVWLTASLPFDLIPENRDVSDAELAADLPTIQQKSLGTVSAGAIASQERLLHNQEIREAESGLASANIAIYPADIKGLISGMEGSAGTPHSFYSDSPFSDQAFSKLSDQQAIQGTMREIASQTGGKAYINQNEVKEGIALAASDELASYSLGYYPENKKWDGKFRTLKVKLNQEDAQLRYRKGFFAITPGQAKNANYESDVAAALEVGAPSTQVSFMAQAKPTEPGKMRVVFLVDAHTLTAEDSGSSKKMNVNLYASLYDAAGKNLGTRSTKVDRAFDAATYQQILDKGMMVPLDLEIPSAAKELRLAVLDSKTGFIGTVSGPIGQ